MRVPVNELRARAERWLADDPDPACRAELRALIDALPGSTADLADRFSVPLAFGTAGLRGTLRAGPNGMNLAVVRQAAAGLVAWLNGKDATGPLVVGHDARHGSAAFAEETVRVATGAGHRALLLPHPVPTPVLAYAVRALPASAGVMVTASHNPATDNGYKVYLGADLGGPGGAGAQIAPPVDAEISAAIRDVGPLSRVPVGSLGELLDDRAVISSYIEGAIAVLDKSMAGTGERTKLLVAHTALHGVGTEVLSAAFAGAGFRPPRSVPEQAAPDPDFPTLPFPNPEEPGVMDRVIALGAAIDADLVVATDPDADRCAVAVPAAGETGWRTLLGDEVGVLLADHLIRRGTYGLYCTTVVSSSLMGALCRARGVEYAETLTGFKWIVRAGGAAAQRLVYGYEEALGYCVAPGLVRDKDGITAALLVAELAAHLKADGRTLTDRLDELATEFGVYATDQVSLRLAGPARSATVMAAVRSRPPRQLLGEAVTSVEDLLPAGDVVILRAGPIRLVVRPSGTEPKLKAYLEVVEPVRGGDVSGARLRAGHALAGLRREAAAVLAV